MITSVQHSFSSSSSSSSSSQVNEHPFKIRLVISNVNIQSASFEQMQCPYAYGNEPQDFNETYTALLIGPFLLQWNSDSSLCIPKRITSILEYVMIQNELVIGTLPPKSLKHITEKMAQFIVKWNVEYISSTSSASSSSGDIGFGRSTSSESFGAAASWSPAKHGNNDGSSSNSVNKQMRNCQQFVDALFKEMTGKQFEYLTGSFAHYCNRVREIGHGEFVYTPSDTILKDFPFLHQMHQQQQHHHGGNSSSGSVTIPCATHKQLDDLVSSMKTSMLKMNHPDDYALLLQLDRLYWLQHSKFPQDSKYKECHEKGCAFVNAFISPPYPYKY